MRCDLGYRLPLTHQHTSRGNDLCDLQLTVAMIDPFKAMRKVDRKTAPKRTTGFAALDFVEVCDTVLSTRAMFPWLFANASVVADRPATSVISSPCSNCSGFSGTREAIGVLWPYHAPLDRCHFLALYSIEWVRITPLRMLRSITHFHSILQHEDCVRIPIGSLKR